jgi:bifunctional DNA-binding transcriptional regulator/antitoxin component of YhaV-PrlF toxin-antitoxin module
VTSKLQLTVPRVIADKFSISPGDEVDWIPAGDGIRIVKRSPPKRAEDRASTANRLRLFDEATNRIVGHSATAKVDSETDRGWTREDLYDRGSVG